MKKPKPHEQYVGLKFIAAGSGKVEYEVKSVERPKGSSKSDRGYVVILTNSVTKGHTEISLDTFKKFI